jgi:hypothetical protein
MPGVEQYVDSEKLKNYHFESDNLEKIPYFILKVKKKLIALYHKNLYASP